jgi:methylated-DNA-[protein]-cysteine S-methyltransferase
MSALVWDRYESPLGPLTLAAGPRGLRGLEFPGRGQPLDERQRRPEALAGAVAQLEAYFAGERQAFELELDLVGTPFQRSVWAALRAIPYGETVSYGELAETVGRTDIVRGVAACVGRTPVPIVVPCHRVIGADGSLTGYGGGLQRKAALLELERRGSGRPSWADRQLALM